MVEQLICNQPVVGSIPSVGSIYTHAARGIAGQRSALFYEGKGERNKGKEYAFPFPFPLSPFAFICTNLLT